MNISTKKRIATEFLALLLCIFIAILSFGTIYIIQIVKIKNFEKEISAKIYEEKEINNAYKIKEINQRKFTEFYTNRFKLSKLDFSNEKVWTKLSSIALNDSVEYKWGKIWNKELIAFNKELGYKTPNDFKNFILKNTFSQEDLINVKKNQILRKEKDDLEKKLNNYTINKVDERTNILLLTFIISFIIIFPLRYLYFAIKWSVKILKQ